MRKILQGQYVRGAVVRLTDGQIRAMELSAGVAIGNRKRELEIIIERNFLFADTLICSPTVSDVRARLTSLVEAGAHAGVEAAVMENGSSPERVAAGLLTAPRTDGSPGGDCEITPAELAAAADEIWEYIKNDDDGSQIDVVSSAAELLDVYKAPKNRAKQEHSDILIINLWHFYLSSGGIPTKATYNAAKEIYEGHFHDFVRVIIRELTLTERGAVIGYAEADIGVNLGKRILRALKTE